jgi:parallel beta-helix repeat protein
MNAMPFAVLGLVAAALALQSPAQGTTLYVANAGSDSAAGSEDAPLATLAAAVARAQSGDSILLRRGDVFRESVKVEAPGLEFGAYGPSDAPRPVVSGAVAVTGWEPYKDRIYVAETEAGVGYLFVDGKLMTIARYPNEGWLRTKVWKEEVLPADAAAANGQRFRRPRLGKTTITCPELTQAPRNAPGYWTGANIRWRHHSWWYETRPIVADDGRGNITLGDRSFENDGPYPFDEKGWGFYIDNKLEELDAPGEWFFDAAEHKVYLYAPEGADPNTLHVEGSSLSTGLSVRDSTVRGICFRYQKDVGLQAGGKCVVEGCLFEGIGRDAAVSERGAGGTALSVNGSVQGTRIAHNEFRNNLNTSIGWWQARDDMGTSVIEHNTIVESGTVPGYGGSGSWHAVGILISTGVQVHVQRNEIDGAGYAGVLLGSDGNTVEENVIRRAMSTLNDGAGIYCNCSRSFIRRNIILDCRGGMESSGTWPDISHGIWLEFLRNYRDSLVEDNTCAGCGADGIFLTNNYNCILRGNVCYDNDRYQLLLSGREAEQQALPEQGHLIVDNILYAARAPEKALYFDPRIDYGTLRGNYYHCAGTDAAIDVQVGWPGEGAKSITLAQWQKDYAWADKEPRTGPGGVSGQGPDRSKLFYNATADRVSVPLDGAYVDLGGSPVAGPIELDPYSSRILIRADTETGAMQ